MPLHVGLDIRKYFDYGIGTYIQELVGELQNDRELQFTYFVSPKDRKQLSNILRGSFVEEKAKLYSIRELYSLSRNAKKTTIDVFHEPHYTFPFFLSVPGIVTIHDIIHVRLKEHFSPLQRTYARTIIQHACHAAKVIIVNAQFTKSELLKYFKVDEKKIHVIYVGIARAFLEKETEERKDDFKTKFGLTKPYILYVGALKSHKNIPVLLKAYSRVRKNIDCDLVLVGESLDAYPALKNLASSLRLTNHIKVLGKISQNDLRCAYQCATMLVFPSLYEGFGSPLVEAMASGTPVVGARSTVIPEIVADAGLLFDPNDEIDLEKNIELLFDDAEQRNFLKEKGQQRANNFSYRQCAQETKILYKKVADGNE